MSDFARSAPFWLRRLGVMSWLLLGILLALGVVVLGFGMISGIAVPLILAVVIASLFLPIVDAGEKRGLPRIAGTILTMLLIAVILVGLIVIVVVGFVQQVPEIADQLKIGWSSITEWLLSLDIDSEWTDSVRIAFQEALPSLGQGIVGAISSTFSSLTAFLIGLFFGVFTLFFMLRDGPMLTDWASRHLALKPSVAAEILADASRSIRMYFQGTAITAGVTSGIVVVVLIALDVPLIIPIFVLYFFTSFIPYVGAFIGGAFAVIIAFGSGGAETALIVLIAVLVSNGMIQSVVSSWAVGSALKLHPLVVLLATAVGGAIGGILAMMFAAPLVAIVIQTSGRLRREGVLAEE